MNEHVMAIRMKIPDNTAYTAQVTLQRLGVEVARVERADIWYFTGGDASRLRNRLERDETVFNPNKHRLAMLPDIGPREGEVWIEPFSVDPAAQALRARRYVGWRLFDAANSPVRRSVVEAAVAALLCNPAIERPIY
ncbi:MAG: hypothetical protein JO092_03685 [Candidatus Eremiobacteraeota bacterium]|nr:hypothetical protein [Candidatus Eremiobacteraeota bacterium]